MGTFDGGTLDGNGNADPTIKDPFTQVLERIWAILEADTYMSTGWPMQNFCDLVLPGNRCKFTEVSQGNPFKEAVLDSDMPECIVEPLGGTDTLAKTSAGGYSDCAFRVMISTGDMRCLLANRMHWILWRIFTAAGDRLKLPGTVYVGDPGLDFIVHTRFSAVVSSTLPPEIARGRKGWAVILTLTCRLQLPRYAMFNPNIMRNDDGLFVTNDSGQLVEVD
jgi:hypothetical protein